MEILGFDFIDFRFDAISLSFFFLNAAALRDFMRRRGEVGPVESATTISKSLGTDCIDRIVRGEVVSDDVVVSSFWYESVDCVPSLFSSVAS